MFVTFEGGEACGKTTQIQLLNGVLQKQHKSVLVTREPGGTSLAAEIRKIFKYHSNMSSITEFLLLTAARSDHVEKVIRPALKTPTFVLCDRFIDSTAVYQGIDDLTPEKTYEEYTKWCTPAVWPDLTIILDLPSSEIVSRLTNRPIEELDRFDKRELEFHEKIRQRFLQVPAWQSSRKFVIINAMQPVEDVHAEIMRIIQN